MTPTEIHRGADRVVLLDDFGGYRLVDDDGRLIGSLVPAEDVTASVGGRWPLDALLAATRHALADDAGAGRAGRPPAVALGLVGALGLVAELRAVGTASEAFELLARLERVLEAMPARPVMPLVRQVPRGRAPAADDVERAVGTLGRTPS